MVPKKMSLIVAVALVASGFLLAPEAARAETIVGSTQVAGASSDRAPGGYKFGSATSVVEAGWASSFTFYAAGGAVTQQLVPAIYEASRKGLPSKLVVAGPVAAVPAYQAPGWVTVPLEPTRLEARRYVLAVLSGPAPGPGASLYYQSSRRAGVWTEDTFPTPAPRWGATNQDDNEWLFAVGLEPVPPTTVPPTTVPPTTVPPTTVPPTTVPPTTVPPTTSGSFGYAATASAVPDSATQGYKFGSVASLAVPATLGTFRFLAAGGVSAQALVPFVYAADASGRPAALVAQGPPIIVAAGQPQGWVSVALPPVAVAPGDYLLGLLAGPTSRGATLYYGPTGGSFWNANAYPTPSGTWGALNPSPERWLFVVDYGTTGTVPPTTVPPTTVPPTTVPPTTVPPTTVPPTTVPPGPGGCPAFPAFPNKTCTGVPAGTTLSTYGGGPVTQDRAVIQNVRITGTVDVRANDVTFRNCWIASTDTLAIAVEQGYNGLTLENCTIKSGGLIAPFSGLTFRRVLVDPDPGAYRPDGIVVGFSSIGQNGQNILIEDSYISPQWGGGGPDPDHTDGIQFWGFGTVSNVTIRHNYIDATNANPDPTAVRVGACAFLADATYVNVTFEYNLCTNSAGGYFHLRLLSNTWTSGHVIRGNRFANRSTVAVDLFRTSPAVWQDNRWADNGDLISQPPPRG